MPIKQAAADLLHSSRLKSQTAGYSNWQAATDRLHSSRLNRRPPVIATNRRPPQQRTAGHSSGPQVRENP